MIHLSIVRHLRFNQHTYAANQGDRLERLPHWRWLSHCEEGVMCSCFAFILATKHRVVLQDRTSTTLWTLKSSLFEGSLPNRTSLDISAETQIVLVHVRQACQMDGSKERKRRFLRLHSSNGFAEAFERLVRAEQKGIKPDEKDRAALRFVLLFFLQCSPGCLFMYVWLRFRD